MLPFPKPPALPRDPRQEQPTPIPRLSDLEEIKSDSPEPSWLVKLRADVRASVKREVQERGSESDLKQDAAIAMAMADIAQVKTDMATLKSQSATTKNAAENAEVATTGLVKSFSGIASPKVIAAAVAIVAALDHAEPALRLAKKILDLLP